MSDREKWLNGWPRMGSCVLIGSAVHCAGCGAYGGTTCVVIPDDWRDPEKLPDWPFEEAKCPICEGLQHRKEHRAPPSVSDRLAAFKATKKEAAEAARYQWLRDSKRLGQWRVQRWEVESGNWNPDRGAGAFETVPGEQLDDAIDDAMRLRMNKDGGGR